MKYKLLLPALASAGILFISFASAAGLHTMAKSSDVVLPLVHGDPSGNDLVSGMLYYNTSNSTFNGIDNLGNKVLLGLSGNSPIVSAGDERSERARITCASSGSGVANQSGSWISSVSNGGVAGSCVVNFNSNVFSAEPSCQCTIITGNYTYTSFTGCYVQGNATTSSIVNGSATNIDVYLNCQGPR